jgi:large subunit ribosomal protein L32
MPVPKQRHTKSRRNKRRMHLFLKKPTFSFCQKCKKPVQPHTVCLNCGYYKGVEVIDVLKKLDKKERKQKEKEIASAEKEKRPLTIEELSKK